MKDLIKNLKGPANRRSFLKTGLAAAGTAGVGAALVGTSPSAYGQGTLSAGDAAILPVFVPTANGHESFGYEGPQGASAN